MVRHCRCPVFQLCRAETGTVPVTQREGASRRSGCRSGAALVGVPLGARGPTTRTLSAARAVTGNSSADLATKQYLGLVLVFISLITCGFFFPENLYYGILFA